uniref:F-box domain-containing protein n=2 Tax=Schistocephalus solidus TaxID=70667 RepID=A0A0V0J1G1_SCHSO
MDKQDKNEIKAWDGLPLQIIEVILSQCCLNDCMACVCVFSRWGLAFPRHISLCERAASYFSEVVKLSKNQSQLHIDLQGIGPTLAGGALTLLSQQLCQQPGCFSNLVSLNLSSQCQPLADLLEIFSSSDVQATSPSAFPALRFLSVRPIEDFRPVRDLTLKPPNFAALRCPPSLEETHLHITGEVLKCSLGIKTFLQVISNVLVLAVCEAFSVHETWSGIIGGGNHFPLFPRLRLLRLTDEGGLQTRLLSLSREERRQVMPCLKELIVDVFCWSRSHRRIVSRLAVLSDYKIYLCDEGVSIRAKRGQTPDRPVLFPVFSVETDKWAFFGDKLRNLTIFMNADAVLQCPAGSTGLPVTAIEAELAQSPNRVCCLGLCSRFADTMGQASDFIGHCQKMALLCRVKLISLLRLAGCNLHFVAMNHQILAACSVDPILQGICIQFRGCYPSVRCLHIIGTIYAVSLPQGITLWASLRYICGLFPRLQQLRISFMLGLDAVDLSLAIAQCPQLHTLFLHRVPIHLDEFQEALLNILSTSRELVALSLILGQIPIGGEVRSWTRAFHSDTLRYLHLELCSGGEVFSGEVMAIAQQIPTLLWVVVKCNDSHVIVANRTQAHDAPVLKEYLRLDTLDLPVICPQLFDLLWFQKSGVSYYLCPNYSPHHFEQIIKSAFCDQTVK